jgi:phospholipid/cholesterol/gamma-HCH transport system substrate-binding protein
MARVLTVGALVLAIAATGLLMFRSTGGYEVELVLDTAGQLVEGNQVKVGGVPVGEVTRIELTGDARARIKLEITDDELEPLHSGTKATVRQTSLSGIANRYLALEPGPNDAPEIPDGGEIRVEDVAEPVDLDLLLNTLGDATQADLQSGTRRSGAALAGRGDDLNAALLALNPALAQAAATERELLRDQAALERLILESADVVSTVASRPEDLERLVGNALGATGALARRGEELESAIGRLPPALRQANTTLVNLRATLRDLRPAVREARPAARPLAEFLTRLQPVAREARPVVGRLRRTIDRDGRSDDLVGVLRGFVPLERAAVPAFESAVRTGNDALPVVRDARPYTPDLVGGLLNGFGGSTGGYYDANGHYARISFHSSVYSLTGAPSLVPLPPSQQGLTGYRSGLNERCPGAATQTAPDGSNPFLDHPDFPCLREDSPR